MLRADASPTLRLAAELISRPSVTPEDAGCQALIAERLTAIGFDCHSLRFGDVENLWAVRGNGGPLFVFAGHTDVVPPGPLDAWSTPPFEPTLIDGWLHGRGAADMKGSLAAMVTACERLLARQQPAARIAFLLTSDEEGPAVDGTVRVMEWLAARGERIDWCLIGEPSSNHRTGDLLRVGRRGSLSGELTVRGKQGHVAYPERALNPVHAAAPALAELAATRWDEGDADFPPASFQISNIHAGTGAGNVIPGELKVWFNLRFGTASEPEALRARIEETLSRHGLDAHIDWTLGAKPFRTADGALREAAIAVICAHSGSAPELSTGGGTSDGRFIAPSGAQVIELGACNATIHQVNERVEAAELDVLSALYEALMEKLLAEG
jgi:succinyl-diaminopimelate desuccinylase